MVTRKSALDMDIDHYFAKLRENVVFSELALMQLVTVSHSLEEREALKDDLRVNLELQEQALKDMLVLSIARLFDPKGRKQDQLSILNILESKKIEVNEQQRAEIYRLASLPAVKTIRRIRDSMVAHTLSHASDASLQGTDIKSIIEGCYSVLAGVYELNKSPALLERKDISIYRTKWLAMTESWS